MRVKRYFAPHLISSNCSAVKFYCSALHSIYAGLWAEIFLRNLNFTLFSLPYAALMPTYGQRFFLSSLNFLLFSLPYTALMPTYGQRFFLRNLNFTLFSLPNTALMPAYGQILL